MINESLSASYLMYELLAVSAAHLAFLTPNNEKYYYHLSKSLQSKALTVFTETSALDDESATMPSMMFSWLLSLHLLREATTNMGADFGLFLEDLVRYLNIHRGIRSIAGRGWSALKQTELKLVITASEGLLNREGGSGTECAPLQSLLDSSDLSATSKDMYTETVGHLQTVFDADRNSKLQDGWTDATFLWPPIISAEYCQAVEQRRPEALIILSYYAVLLHRWREAWFIGKAGEYLIRSITRYLGPHWARWLEMPNQLLQQAVTPEDCH